MNSTNGPNSSTQSRGKHLIADLSPRREIWIHNTHLADELRQVAAELRVLQLERPWTVWSGRLPAHGIDLQTHSLP